MRIRGLAVLIATLVLGSGCIQEKNPALIPDDYSDWSSTVDGELLYEIPGHTTDVRKIYINDTGKQLNITENQDEVVHDYPEGTIIIKENYLAEESSRPVELTVMIKARKDERARGGWLWLAKNVASGEEMIFSDEFCFTCHQNANEAHPYGDRNRDGEFRDFVFYPWNPENDQ